MRQELVADQAVEKTVPEIGYLSIMRRLTKSVRQYKGATIATPPACPG